MEETDERRPKRQKRESSYKEKAFEKFKQLRNKEIKKFEIGEVDNVYEIVDEREYTKKVLSRQDDDWIVNDDGSGYVEDGRDIFDDDLDSESIAIASKGKGVKRKKKAVSENAGKGNLQFLLSNMPAKKKQEEKIDDDETLAELLGEIDDPKSSETTIKPKPIPSNISFSSPSTSFSAKQAANDYMRSISNSIIKSSTKPNISTPKNKTNAISNNTISTKLPNKNDSVNSKSENIKIISNTVIKNANFDDSIPIKSQLITSEPLTILKEIQNNCENANKIGETNSIIDESITESQLIETDITEASFIEDDDFDVTQIEEIESQIDKNPELPNFENEFMKDWNKEGDLLNNSLNSMDCDQSLIDQVGDREILRFFWWDAFEDVQKHPGVVFLFGKTFCEKSRGFVSCCVIVQNIERKIFFLPRSTEENSDAAVTCQDVYNEINESFMKPMQVKHFKARPISKKYAFDPAIPVESDYVEVRYSAKVPGIPSSTQGKTFYKIFGTESTYLEILLLDRKIKGPCWLDIANAVPVTNPISWCKLEFECPKAADVVITQSEKKLLPPPLVVAAINMRCVVNPKNLKNEIVMLTCVSHMKYAVDKQPPVPPFQKHFCVFSCPEHQVLPFNHHEALKNYKATTVQKMNSERALLNYFINQFVSLDVDLVVGHDLHGYQINILCERLAQYDIANFSKLGRLKRKILIKQKLERNLFVGRLVCDIKISAKELIKCRSYDLDSLCQSVLKIKDDQRIELEADDIPEMFKKNGDILKLVSLTMQDTSFILKIMYNLNIVPLALQITNIAGNVMSKTLMGGRSERNEFLLLHAFHDKGYIVPDKSIKKKSAESDNDKAGSRKKPAYSGGLVLDPKIGFYENLILLMDFNSLYPSIIQEYNICFTTIPIDSSDEDVVSLSKTLPPGILPTEIRKLVESRRDVKKLMANPDISNDLRMQYHIRQMALKLTANSMYGCLGFSNSRFYAKNLASMVTYKGREILTNTRDLVQKMSYDVIYGDTDSIMINTMITDFDQVFKIGNKIKQEVNKLYKRVELDIDGVFKYLLLLKKKKYAAVTLTKTKSGQIKAQVEYKGLDIVRRDWSQLACSAGKFILEQIFTDQTTEDRINNIQAYLSKLREDLDQNKVPLPLLIITKQLTKGPNLYADSKALPHVQVALRYNKQFGGHFRAGDTVPFIICKDGTTKSHTERAYHVEELQKSDSLSVDVNYYLSQQIHAVVSRICEPIEGMDSYQIADWLGIESFKKPKFHQSDDIVGENITKPEIKFRNADKFIFKCLACKFKNTTEGILDASGSFLEKCANPECNAKPADFIYNIQNQLTLAIQSYISKYYAYELICEDPMCTNEINRVPLNFSGRHPVCTLCKNGAMFKKYTEHDLYSQLSYFFYIFDFSKANKRIVVEQEVENGYNILKQHVERFLKHSAYSVINLNDMFSVFGSGSNKNVEYELYGEEEDDRE